PVHGYDQSDRGQGHRRTWDDVRATGHRAVHHEGRRSYCNRRRGRCEVGVTPTIRNWEQTRRCCATSVPGALAVGVRCGARRSVMILVTAATGQYGRLVMDALLQKVPPSDL